MSAAIDIQLPEVFTMPVEDSFVEMNVESVIKYYFPENGHYAKTHLNNFGDDTRMNINLGKTVELLAKMDVDPENVRQSIHDTSATMIMALPKIMESLTKVLPEKLDALNWTCTKIDFSLYDPDQFRGYDNRKGSPTEGKPMLGSSACYLVLHLKPVTGKIPVSCNTFDPKNKFKSKPIPKLEAPEVSEEKEQKPKPNVGKTYAGAAVGGHRGKKV